MNLDTDFMEAHNKLQREVLERQRQDAEQTQQRLQRLELWGVIALGTTTITTLIMFFLTITNFGGNWKQSCKVTQVNAFQTIEVCTKK